MPGHDLHPGEQKPPRLQAGPDAELRGIRLRTLGSRQVEGGER